MKRKTQYGGSLRRAVVALLAVVMLFSVCFPALRASAENTEITESTETTAATTETTVETTESTETTEVTEETTTTETESTVSLGTTLGSARAAAETEETEAETITVYLYVALEAESGVDISGWTKNDHGWYTVGYLTVKENILNFENSTEKNGETVYNSSNLTELKAAITSESVTLYNGNPVTIENVLSNAIWTAFKLCNGADNYVEAGKNAYHLDGTLTLTADTTYKLNYDGNAPEGATVSDVPGSVVQIDNAEFTVDSAEPTCEGYVFTGWNTEADGSGTSYAAGGSITVESETTLYAQYEKAYTVTYTDGVDDEEVFEDQVYSDLTEETATPAFGGDSTTEGGQEPTRDGYTFAGWKTANGESWAKTVTADVTYVAQWTENTAIDVNPVDPIDQVEYGYSKSKEATNLDENYESQVTLSLPSAQQELSTDVVFVLDKSTSIDVVDDAVALVEELYTRVTSEGASVNVGVVIFNSQANVEIGLTKLDSTTKDTIIAALKAKEESGTNLHAGLLAGMAMLDADTGTDNARKYLICVTDGITYMYDSEPHVTNIYWINDGSPYLSVDPYSWKFKYGNDAAPSNWKTWLGAVEAILSTNPLDQSDVSYTSAKNGVYDINDYINVQNKNADSYVTCTDIALYKCYSVYQEISSKYYSYIVGKGTQTSYAWGPSFADFLAGGNTVTFEEITNDILYLLDEGTSIVDEIGSGTDEYGNDYNFDFVTDASTLSLKVGDTVYSAVSTGENTYGFGDQTGGTYPYVLTYCPNGTVYNGTTYAECFVWTTNVAITNFARVQLSYKVVLTNPQTTAGTYGAYDQYGSNNDGTTNYGLYTNNSATLYPVDSEGTPGDPDPFQKPTVSYTVEEPTEPTETDPTDPTTTEPTETDPETFDLTVTKVWKDNHNSGSTRPSSITIQLSLNGEDYGEPVVLSKSNSWSCTFEGLPKDDGNKWTVYETVIPSGYKVSYKDGGTTWTITNTLKTTYTSSGTLLQTGQLNWPIPVLTVLGLVLMGTGCAMIIVKKKGRYES